MPTARMISPHAADEAAFCSATSAKSAGQRVKEACTHASSILAEVELTAHTVQELHNPQNMNDGARCPGFQSHLTSNWLTAVYSRADLDVFLIT